MPDVIFNLTVEGLTALSERVAATASSALVEAAKVAQYRARQLAPRRTGALADSIRIGDPFESSGRTIIHVGPTLQTYTRRQELGFHGLDEEGRSYHIGGHRFLARAAFEGLPEMKEVFYRTLRNEI